MVPALMAAKVQNSNPRGGRSSATSPAKPACRHDRDAILDAAEAVVLRDGFGRLSLQAVAYEIGLSKTGLLHHFPNKVTLIDALVRRTVDQWVADTTEAIAATEPGPGRVPRAFLGMCLASTGAFTETIRRSSVVLLAALLHDRSHVEPLRQAHRELDAHIARDGLRKGIGEAAHLAVNGFWFDRIFGLTEWTAPKLAAVRSALDELIALGAAPPRRAHREGSAKKKGTKVVRSATGRTGGGRRKGK